MVNKVHARGRITSIRFDAPLAKWIIVIPVRNNANRVSEARFVVEDDSIAKQLNRGMYVTVEGYVRSFRYFDSMLDEYRSFFSLVATNVEETPTRIELAFKDENPDLKGFYHERPYAEAVISGTVVSARKDNNNWGHLIVKTESRGSDRTTIISFNYFIGARLPAFDYKEGDTVYIVSTFVTSEKVLEGRNYFFQNLIVDDICKVAKSDDPQHDENNSNPHVFATNDVSMANF